MILSSIAVVGRGSGSGQFGDELAPWDDDLVRFHAPLPRRRIPFFGSRRREVQSGVPAEERRKVTMNITTSSTPTPPYNESTGVGGSKR